MKSKMRVDFKGLGDNGFEPVIRIELQDSEDVRDGLLKAFFEKLGGESNWLNVEFQNANIAGEASYITITPVTSNELENTIEEIRGRIGHPVTYKGRTFHVRQFPFHVKDIDEDGSPFQRTFYSQEDIDKLGFRNSE